jgi:hypothetical protein
MQINESFKAWDAIRVARLAPQLGVEKAVRLLLGERN